MDRSDPLADPDEVRATYDAECEGSLTGTIVEAVAAVNDVEVTDLGPLHVAVDPDALEELATSLARSPVRDGSERIEFTFGGCRVVVTSSGEVTVRRRSEGEPRGISTGEEFQTALTLLVREAEANGVAVEGGWACRDGSEFPEWGVEVYEVDES